MADVKITLPSGGGGLVRYFEDVKSKIKFKPHYVLVFIVLVILLEIWLHKSRYFG